MLAVQIQRTSRALDVLTILVFVLALSAPTLDLLFRPDEARSVARENRLAAPLPRPPLELASLSKFPRAFEDWYADRLGCRDLLLRAAQELNWLALRVDPLPLIVRGRDGFDFYAREFAPAIQRGARPATEAELELWRRCLEAQRDRCKRLGAEFVFVLAPNKESIYPDKWPATHVVVGPTRLDQLAAWLRQKSDLEFVDLRPALRAEREFDRPEEDDFVYYRLGSHFTWRAGLASWNAIAAELNRKFDLVRPLPRGDYEIQPSDDGADDTLWDRSYVSDLVRQKRWRSWPRADFGFRLEYDAALRGASSTSSDPTLPTCLFVHDSFGPWMMPFAARSFSTMHAVWTQQMPRHLIERHRPDVVIQEATERVLAWDPIESVADFEPVSAADFETYEPIADATESERSNSPEAQKPRVFAAGADGVIRVPIPTPPDGSLLALHLSVAAPAEGLLVLYFQTRTEPAFSRARSITMNLEAGMNDLFLRLWIPGLSGNLGIYPGSGGSGRLRTLEMRLSR